MTRLLAPLSPDEEILLRRVALGSLRSDARQVQRLLSLALVERSGSALRLTALGRQRYDALAKAPLLVKRRAPMALVIEATLQKFAPAADALSHAAKPVPTPPTAAPAPLHPDPRLPIYFDVTHFRRHAEEHLQSVRSYLVVHRQRQSALLHGSRRCLAVSRTLLDASMPRSAGGLPRVQRNGAFPGG